MYDLMMRDKDGNQHVLLYDPHSSMLVHKDSNADVLPTLNNVLDCDSPAPIDPPPMHTWSDAVAIDGPNVPGRKSRAIRRLKIQLGLKCNYSCGYCLQAEYAKMTPETGELRATAQVERFLANMATWFDGGTDGQGQGVRIEFWGGEPFAYWKVLRPLGLALKQRYPNATFSTVTNGSLFSPDVNDWIEQMDLAVGLSHDGPGQIMGRGMDPFDDPEQRRHLLDIYARRAPLGKMSFNSVLTETNFDLDAIHDWFFERLEGRPLALNLEGIVIPYHEQGRAVSIHADHAQAFMRTMIKAIATGEGLNFVTIWRKIDDFYASVQKERPSRALGQKCGMDRDDSLAVTLNGDVITCQNVSPVASAPNGESHRIGTLSDFDGVEMKSARHFSKRHECMTCPVLQLCKGSCMFLEGQDRAQACDNEFVWNMAIFASALYFATDWHLERIDGVIRQKAPA